MLKSVLAVLLFVLTISSATSQTFTAMLAAGANLAQIDGDRLAGYNKLGLNVGVRVNTRLNDKWHLSNEFLYSQQGASRTPSDNLASPYDRIKLNFVEVPVLINYSDWKVTIGAGFSYQRLIDYTIISDTGEDISALIDYRRNIAGIVLDCAYHFTDRWGMNLRWSRYLNNLAEGLDEQNLIGRVVGLRLYYKL